MKKKVLKGMILVSAMTLSMGVTAFAAGWQKNAAGWWYSTNDARTAWYANEWQWIDGDGDGIAECYYFDQNGYMVSNTITADGSVLGEGGAWTVNGVVQTKQVGNTTPSTPAVDYSTPKADLADITPDYSASVGVLEESLMAGGEDWEGAIQYRRGNGQDYARADYYLGGAYNTLNFKAAPNTKRFGDGDIVVLNITNQETGEVLYRKGSIKEDTHVFSGTVDVSGVNYLRIEVTGDPDYKYDGTFGYLLLKDTYLY